MNMFKRYTVMMAVVAGIAVVTIPVAQARPSPDAKVPGIQAHRFKIIAKGAADTRLVDFDGYCYIQADPSSSNYLVCSASLDEIRQSLRGYARKISPSSDAIEGERSYYAPMSDSADRQPTYLTLTTALPDSEVILSTTMACAEAGEITGAMYAEGQGQTRIVTECEVEVQKLSQSSIFHNSLRKQVEQ